jgi:hypothetical protein
VSGISRQSLKEPGQTGCTIIPWGNPLPVSGKYEKSTKATADMDELDTWIRTCIIQQLNYEYIGNSPPPLIKVFTDQVGSCMTEYLLSKGCEVSGMVCRSTTVALNAFWS